MELPHSLVMVLPLSDTRIFPHTEPKLTFSEIELLR
jgi:hypothetical protein